MIGYKKDIVFSTIAIGFALITGTVAFGYPTESSYFPRALSVFLGLMALLLLVRLKLAKKNTRAARHTQQSQGVIDEEKAAQIDQLKSAGFVFGAIIVYVAIMNLVNYEIATVVFLTTVMVSLGYRHIIWVPAISIGLTVFLHGVFFGFLGVTRPESIWF